MIKSWRVRDFKSVYSETSLPFAPITVFAGANSSGKSTILQSILLAAQSLQSPVPDRPIVLNGHLARLGSFEDIVAGAKPDGEVKIGFDLQVLQRDYRRTIRHRGLHGAPLYYLSRLDADGVSVSVDFSFSMRGAPEDRDVLRLQPRLERSALAVRALGNESRESSIQVNRLAMSPEQRLEQLGIGPDSFEGFLGRELTFDAVAKLHASDKEASKLSKQRLVSAGLTHFLPSYLTYIYDAVDTEVRSVVDSLTAKDSLSWRALDEDLDEVFAEPELRRVALAVLGQFEKKISDDDYSKPLPSFRRTQIMKSISELRKNLNLRNYKLFMTQLTPVLRGTLAQLFAENEHDLKAAVRRGRSEQLELESRPLPNLLATGAGAAIAFFSNSLLYLGPLRDEPKSVYPLAGATDPSDVGLRGENTAAVLDLHRNTIVENIAPSKIDTLTSVEHVGERVSLLSAVTDWLQYVGVGTDVSTEDKGKLGHQLQVRTDPSARMHDLTQVGVGVSQVLPILVSALLAPRGATLVLEQPELHLHPRVQSRLADFFVALHFLGKQCIVETHSEYFLARLRYRAVKAVDDSVASSIRVYFVEKKDRVSTYRPVTINEFGAIEDWPAGFFDEREGTSSQIIRAAIEKKDSRRLG